MGTRPGMRGSEATVLSALTLTPAVERPPVPPQAPGDPRLGVGLGASMNNSQGRPFNPDLTAWET